MRFFSIVFLALAIFGSSTKADLVPKSDPLSRGKNNFKINLEEVGSGFTQITDLQFFPGKPSLVWVLSKRGRIDELNLQTRSSKKILGIAVSTSSEQGLLGLAFHPDFKNQKKFYLHYSTRRGFKKIGRISEWTWVKDADSKKSVPKESRILVEVDQPYSNHNAGQIAFGPDGFLYIGFGDGGAANDPKGHGQNTETLLGSMIRIDVNAKPTRGKQYAIPADNPFVGKKGFLPEIWAYGLRNPWKFTFNSKGDLIVADVGQYEWEEVSILSKGANAGWKIREGKHCFSPETNCRTKGLVDPVAEYSHEEGISITGGFVYSGNKIPNLKNHYLYADYGTGRIWALPLSKKASHRDALWLGRFDLNPATFGIDAAGEIYIAGFTSGKVYRLKGPQQ